jgi:hypothetical protein
VVIALVVQLLMLLHDKIGDLTDSDAGHVRMELGIGIEAIEKLKQNGRKFFKMLIAGE